MAKNNPFRFSTKYQDDESDLLYYGYRYYKPSTGTWPNRDPLGERGFAFVANKPEAGKKSFSERVQIAIEFLQSQNPLAVESFKRNIFESSRGQMSEQSQQPYAFVANSPVNSFDFLGLESPSSGYKCDEGLLTAARILCYLACVVPGGRPAVIAHTCHTGCWDGCNNWCLNQYLDNKITEDQMKLCSADCSKRDGDCVKSGCKLKFN